MKRSRTAKCPCGSGRKRSECCGVTPSRDQDFTARLMGAISLQGTIAPSAAAEKRLRKLVVRLEEALQDPRGDVTAALQPLERCFNSVSPTLLEAIDQVLYHGHGAAVLAFLQSVLSVPRADSVEIETLLPSHDLRHLALQLLLDHAATAIETQKPEELLAAARRFLLVSARDVRHVLSARRALGPTAVDPQGYRYDRPGCDLVPRLECLTLRFGLLLHERHDWPLSRSRLAASQIDALLLRGILRPFDPGLMHSCRDCALEAPARPDAGPGATALALDLDSLVAEWPRRLAEIGGPMRAAALLEALPHWMGLLVELQLVDGDEGNRLVAELVALGKHLAPSLVAELDDRALAAAARRLAGDGETVH